MTYNRDATADEVKVGDHTLTLSDKENNYVDKIISVTNTGKSDAYIRTLVAVPTGGGDWEPTPVSANNCWLHWNVPTAYGTYWTLNSTATLITVDGVSYYVWEFVHKEAVASKETTFPMVRGFYMDKRVNNYDDGSFYMTYEDGTTKDIVTAETVDILVLSQAVQAEGFANAQTALDEAFGTVAANAATWFAGDEFEAPAVVNTAEDLAESLKNGDDVVLTDSVEKDADETTPYGNKAGYVQYGGVFDGNGETLTINDLGDNGSQGSWGIETHGGTIKNVTIEGAFRGIVLYTPTEDVIIDNVTVKDNVGYPMNTAEHPTMDGIDLVVSNSTFGGWTSFAGIETASFTKCDFVVGTYYDQWPYDSLVKPYVNTTFTDCTFADKYYLDLSALGEGCSVTLKNCTVNGQALTANICGTECDGTETFCVELPSGRTLADCVIFK